MLTFFFSIDIARMLKCKIYAPYKKKRILLCQQDDELKAMLTNNPNEAQVHVVPLRDIRADVGYTNISMPRTMGS